MKNRIQLLKKIAFAAGVALMVGSATTASADIVTWTSTDLVAGGINDAFISTNGTSVLAFNGTELGTGSIVANGVTFQNVAGGLAGTAASHTGGGITVTASDATGNTNAFQTGSFSGTNVGSLIEGAWFNTPEFDITGLTPGNTYEIQFLINDSRTGGSRNDNWVVGFTDGVGAVVDTIGNLHNSTSSTDNNGDSLIGTFTPTTSTSNFVLTATRSGNISVGDAITVVPNGGQRQVNAFQLRDITAVPEPSSLMILSLGSLLLLKRRR